MTCLASSPAQVYRRGGWWCATADRRRFIDRSLCKTFAYAVTSTHAARTPAVRRVASLLLLFFLSSYNIRDRASSMALREHFCQGGTFRNETEKGKETLFYLKKKRTCFSSLRQPTGEMRCIREMFFFFFGGSKKRTHHTLVSHHLYPPLTVYIITFEYCVLCVCQKGVHYRHSASVIGALGAGKKV